MSGRITLKVSDEHDGARLDVLLVSLLDGPSRSRVQSWIRAGRVQVDGVEAAKPRMVVLKGAEILVLPEAEGEVDLREDPTLDFTVLMEDEHLAVIDKPAGLIAHRNEKHQSGTIADLATARWGELPSFDEADRPGIVHRLDRETSGVMLIAKSEAALTELRRQFQDREVDKTYLALVYGSPRFDSDWVDERIGMDPRHRDRKGVVGPEEGKEASTFYETLERFGSLSLLSCKPKTGRTHQIRVHMLHIGHPVWMDSVYRPRSGTPVKPPADAPVMTRHALHAHVIEFTHPVSGKRVSVTSELEGEFAAFVEWLRNSGGI